MTTRLTVVRVPEVQPPPGLSHDQRAAWVKLEESRRIVDSNFRTLRDALDRAIQTGGLISEGTVTLEMLEDIALAGDVTGELGGVNTTTVERLRNKSLPAPAAGDDGKAITYNHAGSAWAYVDKLTDVLTTRGDLLIRGASAEGRLAVGGANTLLKSDGTDPSWSTLTALLDALFSSTQGAVLYRGAGAWAALGPGTSGHFLKTQGAGANPTWDSAASGSAHDLLSATHEDTDPAAAVLGDLITAQDVGGTDTWKRLAVGSDGDVLSVVSGEPAWVAPSAGAAHALLSATHNDTTAAAVVRGDLIAGIGSSPTWSRLAKGTRGDLLRINANEPEWRDGRKDFFPRYHAIHMARTRSYNQDSGFGRAMTTSGTAADAGDATRAATKVTDNTTGDIGWRAGAGALEIQARHYPYARWDAKLTDGVDGCLWMGLYAAATFPNTAALAAEGAAFRWRNGTDTNIQCVTRDSGGTQDTQDSGVAMDTAWHDYELYTDDGGTTWRFLIDGVLVKSMSTNVPTNTTAMAFLVYLPDISSSARDLAFSYASLILNPRPTV